MLDGFRPVGSLQAGGIEHTAWDEAAECEQQAAAPIAELLGGGTQTAFTVPGGIEHEDLPGPGGGPAGRLDRQRESLHGVIRLSAERMPGPYGALRLRVVLENRTEPRQAAGPPGGRPAVRADRRALPDRSARRPVPVHDGPARSGPRAKSAAA